jgi:hypothetical protein
LVASFKGIEVARFRKISTSALRATRCTGFDFVLSIGGAAAKRRSVLLVTSWALLSSLIIIILFVICRNSLDYWLFMLHAVLLVAATFVFFPTPAMTRIISTHLDDGTSIKIYQKESGLMRLWLDVSA